MANLRPGDEAVPFELPGVDDGRHSLADHADRDAVAVVFTCNHCPYAQAWEGRLVQAQSDYAGRGAQLVAISSNDAGKHPADGFPEMKRHAEERGFNFPYLYDESQEIARAYGAERTPEVFLFDGAGTLRYHGTVDDNYDDPAAVEDRVDGVPEVVGPDGREPAPAETKPVGCTIKWK